jgi:hypothetical protein
MSTGSMRSIVCVGPCGYFADDVVDNMSACVYTTDEDLIRVKAALFEILEDQQETGAARVSAAKAFLGHSIEGGVFRRPDMPAPKEPEKPTSPLEGLKIVG